MDNKLLTIMLSIFIFSGCSTLNEYQKEHEQKTLITSAEESCSFSRQSCYDLGTIYYKQKKFPKAKQAFGKACSIFDKMPLYDSVASQNVTHSCLAYSQLSEKSDPTLAKKLLHSVLLRYQNECAAGNKYACQFILTLK